MGPARSLRQRNRFPLLYFDTLENSIDRLVNQHGRYRNRRRKGDRRCRRPRLKWSDPLPGIFNATPSAVHSFTTSHVQNYSWQQLAKDNDILLAIFVQPAVPDVSLKKIGSFNLDLGEKADEVFNAVRDLKSSPNAVDIFKAIPPLGAYLANLEGNERKENFRHLCSLYLKLWREDCPFYLASTLQYDEEKPQVCVRASQLIKKGEDIRWLVAFGAALSGEAVQNLEKEGKDFSLMKYGNMVKIILGLFQYVNSDCEPNACFDWIDPGSVGIEALRDIKPHEEILVKYGCGFFGAGNAGCRCLTCGKGHQNEGYWHDTGVVRDSEDEDSDIE